MKKGFYFIVIHDRDKNGETYMKPELKEGSYEYYGKLFVHRPVDWNGWANHWKVSHVDSGSNIASNKSLKEARAIAKGLQGFPMWELKDHQALCDAVKCPSNEDQVNKIKKVLGILS